MNNVENNDVNLSRVRNISNDIIEIDFSGLNPTKRLELLKLVYKHHRDKLLCEKSHGNLLEPDDFIRKTYYIKTDVAQAFLADANKKKIQIGKHVSSLLNSYINAIDAGTPAKSEKTAIYKKQSYRIQYSTALRFAALCAANNVPVGPVLQTFMEKYLEKER